MSYLDPYSTTDIHQLVVNKVQLTLERLVTSFKINAEVIHNVNVHSDYNHLYRALDVYVEAAVHSLTRDSADFEVETVEKTFDATLENTVIVSTYEPASWWQHFKKQRGWNYETKKVEHKVLANVTGPVTAKFTVPVKKSYKKVFFGLPSSELAYRVYNMYPESDYEKSEEYWSNYIMKHKEAAMYMAPIRYKNTVDEVAVR